MSNTSELTKIYKVGLLSVYFKIEFVCVNLHIKYTYTHNTSIYMCVNACARMCIYFHVMLVSIVKSVFVFTITAVIVIF